MAETGGDPRPGDTDAPPSSPVPLGFGAMDAAIAAAAAARNRRRRQALLITGIALVTIAAAYLGVALGDSIQGGGRSSASAPPPLPTRAPGVREVACGTGPINLEQGTQATLTFDAKPLPGFAVSNVAVQALSSGASQAAVEAKAQEGLSVRFDALRVPGDPGRVDEYRLTVTFTKSDERTVSECTILVKAPDATPTPTAAPSPTTAPPTSTPLPTLVPTLIPTAVPTLTPQPPTPTPTIVPLFTPTLTPAPVLTPSATLTI